MPDVFSGAESCVDFRRSRFSNYQNCNRKGQDDYASNTMVERGAMILGMNPRPLRTPRMWSLCLWLKRHHWVLVAQPLGEDFTARIVDDFVHNAQFCFSVEVPCSQFFLVYELLVEPSGFFLMLSVKPDFNVQSESVCSLGTVGPLCFEELQEHAISVVRRYRSYSLVGCNCQHFATDLALSLGASPKDLPKDEATAIAHAASDGAVTVGTASVIVAATAAIGACCASAAGPTAASLLGAVPVVLSSVAVGATAVGAIGGLALFTLAGGYKALYDGLREDEADAVQCPEGANDDEKG